MRCRLKTQTANHLYVSSRSYSSLEEKNLKQSGDGSGLSLLRSAGAYRQDGPRPHRFLLLVHPDSAASRARNEDLNISFATTRDYAGIAKAASRGKAWPGRAAMVDELAGLLPEAVDFVAKSGTAVLDAHLDGSGGKFVGGEERVAREKGREEGGIRMSSGSRRRRGESW